MGWYESVKKYLWNDSTTPYFIRVDALNRHQARKEIFVYVLFLAVLFAFVAVAALAGMPFRQEAPAVGNPLPDLQRHEPLLGAALYAFLIVGGAVYVGVNKHPLAAMLCATAPVAAFLTIFLGDLHPNLGRLDKILLLVLCVAWGWYALRVVAITRVFPHMPEGPTSGYSQGV